LRRKSFAVAQAVELDLSAWNGRTPQELMGGARFPRIGELPYLVTLPPYGFYWFQLHSDRGRRLKKLCRGTWPRWFSPRAGIRCSLDAASA